MSSLKPRALQSKEEIMRFANLWMLLTITLFTGALLVVGCKGSTTEATDAGDSEEEGEDTGEDTGT